MGIDPTTLVLLASCSKQLSSPPRSVMRIISHDDMWTFELTHMQVKGLKRLLLFLKVLEKSENYWVFFFNPKFNPLYTVDEAQNSLSKKEIKKCSCFFFHIDEQRPLCSIISTHICSGTGCVIAPSTKVLLHIVMFIEKNN